MACRGTALLYFYCEQRINTRDISLTLRCLSRNGYDPPLLFSTNTNDQLPYHRSATQSEVSHHLLLGFQTWHCSDRATDRCQTTRLPFQFTESYGCEPHVQCWEVYVEISLYQHSHDTIPAVSPQINDRARMWWRYNSFNSLKIIQLRIFCDVVPCS
jgi:hypothetical protein